MKLWIASTFWNEFDLLDVRRAEHAGIATQVLVEGDRTFQGELKPRALQGYCAGDVFHSYAVLPEQAKHPMDREAVQRNALLPALQLAGATPDDVVVICDADEIPSRDSLIRFLEGRQQTPVRLGVRLYHYWLNLRIVGGDVGVADGYWYAPIAVRMRDLAAPRLPHWWRQQANVPKARDVGWSFSFLGDVESHIEKIHSWAHVEWATPEYCNYDNVEEARRLGRDWDFKRNLDHAWVDIDDSYPAFIRENMERFGKYLGVVPIDAR